jgi:hypothetical protein
MKVITWAAALAVGALVALFLGLSMLAASQTTRRVKAMGNPQLVLRQADLTAMSQSLAQSAPATKTSGFTVVKVPCMPPQHVVVHNGEGEASVEWQVVGHTPAQQRIATVQQARCLNRHGFLGKGDLDSITHAKYVRTRHGLSSVVPLSLQIVPSAVPLTIWSLVLTLEVVGLFFFRRVQRHGHGGSSPNG